MIIIGLGNPGQEYEGTRHNAGREAVMALGAKMDLEFKSDKKSSAQVAKKGALTLVLPDTFMNKSGVSVGKFAKGAKKVKNPATGKSMKAYPQMIVVHDDLDIPLGKAKMSWNKSAGGHKGVQSVLKALGTEGVFRVRIGITPAKANGDLKKPDHETITDNFIVAEFKEKEALELKKVMKKVVEYLELAINESPERAMGELNGSFK